MHENILKIEKEHAKTKCDIKINTYKKMMILYIYVSMQTICRFIAYHIIL